MTSWQGYIDKNLVGFGIDRAAIFGHDGTSKATSPGFDVNFPEIQSLVRAFEDPSDIRHHGIHVGGVDYFTRKSNQRSIYGKNPQGGVAIVKTLHNIVIGVYGSKLIPAEANSVVEGFADYLILVGE
ncbi:MAG: profilin [Calothrix sp. MO_192.B10]|nr:profilin [Calothrix sp. MO_192.B10]